MPQYRLLYQVQSYQEEVAFINVPDLESAEAFARDNILIFVTPFVERVSDEEILSLANKTVGKEDE